MGMVITMVLTNRSPVKLHLNKLLYSTIVLLLVGPFAYADTKIQPKLSANTYAFWYQNQQISSGTDRGLALLLTPEISVIRTTPNVVTSLYWQNEAVWYKDAQRSQHSAQTYRISNIVSAYNQRISWGLNAAGGYRVRDSRQGIYADIITSAESLSKTRNYGTHLNFTTLSGAATQANLLLAYDTYTAEGSFLGEDDGYSNDSYSGVLNLASASRSETFFWQLNGNYNLVERDNFNDFKTARGSAILGLPVLSRLSLILRSSYEKNEGSLNFNNEFFSYGVGAELKFGKVSWLNVTWNKSRLKNETANQATANNQDDEYIAGEFFLAPSRRTSLSFSLDQRYFGRTMTLSGNYNLRYITIRLAATDTVRTQSQLIAGFEDLGIFVCPDGSFNLNDCFRPPTNNYIPRPGESFQQLGLFNPELSERVVLSRNLSLGVGYSKNKLSVNISANSGEDEYEESQELTRRHGVTMQALWRIYSDLNANLNASMYRFNYTDDERVDKNMSAEFGLTYFITRKTELSAEIRHVRRDSTLASADISETRLGLGISYAF